MTRLVFIAVFLSRALIVHEGKLLEELQAALFMAVSI
jgi:hypothetical protein